MFGLQVNRALPESIVKQLTQQLRRKILSGELKRGERLPSSRDLAREFNIARNIIIQVYEQLLAEGYLNSHIGSGTFVAGIGDYHMAPAQSPSDLWVTDKPPLGEGIYFDAGNPDSTCFPRIKWAKLYKEVCLDSGKEAYEYGPIAGARPLRCAIGDYLYRIKGIQCHLEQIFIVPGASRGIELVARVLCREERGGCAVIEDPSLDYVQHIIQQNGLKLLPVTVDKNGIQTELLPEDSTVRLVYVVPSHQFPLGCVLPIDRRLQLLTYVSSRDAYVIEDDYDSEFRYQGDPIQSLRHLNPDRVIYLGTFSKILSPGLRLGYVIMPRPLCALTQDTMEQLNIRSSTMEQLTMAGFLNQRILDRHVFRLKKIYEEKRTALITAIKHEFGSKMTISGTNAGLHVLATYARALCPEDFSQMKTVGVEADWVENYAILKGRHRNQLVLGYGNLSIDQISLGVQLIKKALAKW